MDIKLDPETSDLDISNNSLHVTEEGSESIAQRLRIRLRFFFREWVLDRSAGTKWFEVVLRKGVTKYAVDQEIRRVVLNTYQIKTIESWESSLDDPSRKYEVRFSVKSTQGETLSFGFSDIYSV
jgi:hypothetical protein